MVAVCYIAICAFYPVVTVIQLLGIHHCCDCIEAYGLVRNEASIKLSV